MTSTNQKDVSEHPWRCWEKLTFILKLRLRASILFVWKLLSRQKKKVEGRGTFRKRLGSGTETFSDRPKSQTPCDMTVIDTIQWVSMEKVWLFNVAPLDGTFLWYFQLQPEVEIWYKCQLFLVINSSSSIAQHYQRYLSIAQRYLLSQRAIFGMCGANICRWHQLPLLLNLE